MTDAPTFSPSLFYRDPRAALKWLEAAFGFETSILLTDAEGQVAYSEMSFLGGSVSINPGFTAPDLIGTAQMVSPLDVDGRCTQFLRVHMPTGLDAHHERAQAAGARITQAPRDEFYGERTYRAMDPEGHVWTFAQPAAAVSAAEMEAASGLKVVSLSKEAGHG